MVKDPKNTDDISEIILDEDLEKTVLDIDIRDLDDDLDETLIVRAPMGDDDDLFDIGEDDEDVDAPTATTQENTEDLWQEDVEAITMQAPVEVAAAAQPQKRKLKGRFQGFSSYFRKFRSPNNPLKLWWAAVLVAAVFLLIVLGLPEKGRSFWTRHKIVAPLWLFLACCGSLGLRSMKRVPKVSRQLAMLGLMLMVLLFLWDFGGMYPGFGLWYLVKPGTLWQGGEGVLRLALLVQAMGVGWAIFWLRGSRWYAEVMLPVVCFLVFSVLLLFY